MAFDYQNALDRIANTFGQYNARRLALAERDRRRQEELADDAAQRAFTRSTQERGAVLGAEAQERSGRIQRSYLREQDRLIQDREEERLRRLDREQITNELDRIGVKYDAATDTESLRKFLADVRGSERDRRTGDLRSALDQESKYIEGLRGRIESRQRELQQSAISDAEKRRIALQLSGDSSLGLSEAQSKGLALFAAGKQTQTERGKRFSPMSPDDVLAQLAPDKLEAFTTIYSSALENIVKDPRKRESVISLASQIGRDVAELDAAEKRRSKLYELDPTLPRPTLTEPIRTGGGAAVDPDAQRQATLAALAGRTPPAPPAAVARPRSDSAFVPASEFLAESAIPGSQFTPMGAVASGVGALVGATEGTPAVPGARAPSAFIPAQSGLVRGGAQFLPQVAPDIVAGALTPTNPLSPFTRQAVDAARNLGGNVVRGVQGVLQPGIEQLRSFVGPRLQEFTMKMFGVDNPNASPEEVVAVETLAKRTRGYTDADLNRKRELLRSGDMPTLREFFDYLKAVRNQNAARAITSPAVQTETGSTNVFMVPDQP